MCVCGGEGVMLLCSSCVKNVVSHTRKRIRWILLNVSSKEIRAISNRSSSENMVLTVTFLRGFFFRREGASCRFVHCWLLPCTSWVNGTRRQTAAAVITAFVLYFCRHVHIVEENWDGLKDFWELGSFWVLALQGPSRSCTSLRKNFSHTSCRNGLVGMV